jgi:hypothetical protein
LGTTSKRSGPWPRPVGSILNSRSNGTRSGIQLLYQGCSTLGAGSDCRKNDRSALFKLPTHRATPSPLSDRVCQTLQCVSSGKTSKSISFSLKTASYRSRPRLRSQPPRSMMSVLTTRQPYKKANLIMRRLQPACRSPCGASQSRLAWSEAPQRRSPKPCALSPRRHRR